MPLQLIDTHAHLDLEHFSDELSGLLDRCKRGIFPEPVEEKIFERTAEHSFQMQAVVIPGISAASSRECLVLAERSPILYAAVGIHPNSIPKTAPGDWETIELLAEHPRAVAVGETGLDRYWDTTPFASQIESFEKHIDLAKRRNLPILIHSREADNDLLPILKRESTAGGGNRLRGIVHAFSSGGEVAEKCLEYGFDISFAGSLTYTNRKFAPLWEAAKIVPEDRLLIETDAPYLIPHPYRSQLQRNEPLMVAFTAKRLAELRGCPLEEIVARTTANAQRVFGLTASEREA